MKIKYHIIFVLLSIQSLLDNYLELLNISFPSISFTIFVLIALMSKGGRIININEILIATCGIILIIGSSILNPYNTKIYINSILHISLYLVGIGIVKNYVKSFNYQILANIGIFYLCLNLIVMIISRILGDDSYLIGKVYERQGLSRSAGLFDEPSFNAFFTTIIFGLAYEFGDKKYKHFIATIYTISLFFILSPVCLVFLLIFFYDHQFRRYIIYLLLPPLITLLVLDYEYYIRFYYGLSDSLLGRYKELEQAFNIIGKNLIFGVGIGGLEVSEKYTIINWITHQNENRLAVSVHTNLALTYGLFVTIFLFIFYFCKYVMLALISKNRFNVKLILCFIIESLYHSTFCSFLYWLPVILIRNKK